MKAPKVDRQADAEALLWDVRVADEIDAIVGDPRTVYQHYLRIKVFTTRGREAFATVDIPHLADTDIVDVAARTVRPDGNIIELKKSDVYRRTIVKANDLKLEAVSFAVPGIEVGAIVEYQWREVQRDSLASYLRLPFSREIPVHRVQYHIRPLGLLRDEFTMRAIPFNGAFTSPEREKDGFTMVSLSNVAADADETYGPPPFENRPWLFIYYDERTARPDMDWQRFAKDLHDDYARRSKPNDDIRAVAKSISGSTDRERIGNLIRAAREQVKRVDVDTADSKDWVKARDNRNAADTWKRGFGTGDDMVTVVLALAGAAGFDARVAAVPNRADLFHKQAHSNPYFVRGRLIAVRSANDWLIFDPANEQSAIGELRWYYEWQEVLVADSKQLTTVKVRLSTPDNSLKRRTGVFTLSEDGTLEGECRVVYTGHLAQMWREQEDQNSPAEQEKSLRELVTKRLPNAELTDIRLDNVGNPAEPYTQSYKIRVPGYAQRAGSRLFVQPGVFQRGVEALFTATDRKSDIYFPYPWMEQDEITIALPKGYLMEPPTTPAPMDVGSGRYVVRVTTGEGSTVRLTRQFVFGQNDAIFFRQPIYPQLKKFFDEVAIADALAISVRREAGQE